MNPDSNKMADQVEPTISTLINEKHLKQLMEDVRGSDDGNWWVLISALREWATWYFFQKYKFIRCFHCNNPRQNLTKLYEKFARKTHTTALFVFFSSSRSLLFRYLVYKCSRIFLFIQSAYSISKIIFLTWAYSPCHNVYWYSFVAFLLFPFVCSAQCRFSSNQIKSVFISSIE